MSVPALTFLILAIAAVGWQLGRRRAFAVAGGAANARTLHSRPVYFGALTALWCAIPALLLLGLWAVLRGSVVTELVVADLPPELRDLPANELALVVNDIRNQVEGNFVRDDVSPVIMEAADRYRTFDGLGRLVSTVVAPLVALLGLALAWRRIAPGCAPATTWRARSSSSSSRAPRSPSLTTAGIVLSVLFEAFRFFRARLLFGIEWSPQTAIRSDGGARGRRHGPPLHGHSPHLRCRDWWRCRWGSSTSCGTRAGGFAPSRSRSSRSWRDPTVGVRLLRRSRWPPRYATRETPSGSRLPRRARSRPGSSWG